MVVPLVEEPLVVDAEDSRRLLCFLFANIGQESAPDGFGCQVRTIVSSCKRRIAESGSPSEMIT